MDEQPQTFEDAATLDPPGTIAVIGAGPLGIEAALYGRYLGYDVTLFEADDVVGSLTRSRDEAIPMLPDRCASPLAVAALTAQAEDAAPRRSPLTIGEWIDQVWRPLVETDLLRGRVRCPARVVSIGMVEESAEDSVDAADGSNTDGNNTQGSNDGHGEADIPPDFRLTLSEGQSEDFEAVILATGDGTAESAASPVETTFPTPADYLFEIDTPAGSDDGNAEQVFWGGLKQIVAIYASLGGRADLDLYRPRGAEADQDRTA